MERIKRFFMDEGATAEAAGTTVMIAAAGILLAAAISAWYTVGLTNIFGALGTSGTNMAKTPWGIPG